MKKRVCGSIGIVLVTAAIGSALIVAVAQPPPIPEQYSGTAILEDDIPAQVGTPVTVEVYGTGEEVGNTIVSDASGSYSLLINFDVAGTVEDEGADEGDPLTWKISGIECDVPSPGTDTAESGKINSDFLLVARDTTPPVVTNPGATPPSIPADGVTASRLNVTVTDESGVDVVVVIDLSAIGGSATEIMYYLGDNIYSTETTAAEGTTPGTYFLRVNATDINGNYNDTVGIALEVTAVTGDININEIMYNPSTGQGSDADMEWLELYNNDVVPINISGWTIDNNTIITEEAMQPGDYLVLVRNKTAFEGYYGALPCSVIEATFSLTNNPGDTIVLKDGAGVEIDNVTYIDDWGADGNGKTLELNETGGWEESLIDGGTPGEVNSVTDWNPWDDDCIITDVEISMAEYHWATSTPKNGHTITDAEISLLEYQWATGDVC
ncbi:lamin tail domain-containing protein [Methanophagales archaeon]|nr:MAG: lamin tail domain-containing protein [Methanophagales archaeon]